jgi:serine/threonine-protein kinase
MSTPREDYSLPLIHDPESASGSSFPGFDEAPTQVKPHGALGFTTGSAPPTDAASTQLLGARLDHFELLDSIGVGGMGRVFRARDTRLDRLVALKVLSPELSNDPEICRRFEQEAKAAARLDDRHFARVFFFGYDKGLRYIAMEYVDGENIRQKIARSGKLSVALAVNIGIQIARGLAHAAACGVVHRDIKPSNIILTPDGTAKLVDMGLARNFFQQSSPSSELTQAGVTLGTFDYISPEQALDPRDADVRSDIYSLGCTLYHALTGRPPFSKGSALQKILQHQNDAVPDPRRFSPELPEPIVSILLKMLAKDPKDRYQHPVELIDDLRAVASLLEIPLPDELGQSAPVQLRQGFWERQIAWAAPLAVLLAGVAAYALLDRPNWPTVSAPGAPAPPIDEDRARPVNVESTTPSPLPTPGGGSPLAREASRYTTSRTAPPDADLWRVLQDAPAGTRISLLGRRYILNGAGDKAPALKRLSGKRLRIEPAAENGLVEIVVRPSAWSPSQPAGSAGRFLMELEDSFVEFRRVALLVDPPAAGEGNPPTSGAVLRLRGGTLRLVECALRLHGGGRVSPIAAVEIDDSEGRPSDWLAERCVFVGSDELVRVTSTGAANVELVDCAADHISQAPFRFDGVGDATLAMEHTSIRTSTPRMFRAAELGALRVQTHACVFATASNGASPAPFVDVVADGGWQDPNDSWYTGLNNLYIGFSQITVQRTGTTAARGFAEARKCGFEENAARMLRGSEGVFASTADFPLGMTADACREAVRRLVLAPEARGASSDPVGVRRTPWGDLYADGLAVETAAPTVPAPPPSSATPSPIAPPPPPSYVVDPTTKDRVGSVYASLRQAVDEAEDNATIHLRVNGEVAAAGVVVAGKRVALRPAEGFSPVLALEDDGGAAEPIRLSAGGAISLVGVPVRVDAPDSTAGVFELNPGASVQFADAWIRVNTERGGGAPPVFRIRNSNPASSGGASARVELSRSIVRTAGTILNADAPHAWSLSAVDSYLVTGAAALRLDAARSSPSNAAPAQLRLKRTSVSTGGPLFAATGVPPSFVATVDDSVILGRSSAPLLEAHASTADDAASLLRWQGRQNFLAGFAVFLSTTRPDSIDTAPLAVPFGPWAELQNLEEGSHLVGQAGAVALRTGQIGQEPPPNFEVLRQAGFPQDAEKLPGVNPQLLPSEIPTRT